jgi:cyanate permease
MLLVGYILSAIGPFAFGVARDATGDFVVSLWLLVGTAALLFGLCALATPARLRGIGSDDPRGAPGPT